MTWTAKGSFDNQLLHDPMRGLEVEGNTCYGVIPDKYIAAVKQATMALVEALDDWRDGEVIVSVTGHIRHPHELARPNESPNFITLTVTRTPPPTPTGEVPDAPR